MQLLVDVFISRRLERQSNLEKKWLTYAATREVQLIKTLWLVVLARAGPKAKVSAQKCWQMLAR